jgi:hypothetical protein
MIVTAHIKFSIGTTFLDNFFTAEDERLPGESIEDGVLRVRKHLINAIERLKQEVDQGFGPAIRSDGPSGLKYYTPEQVAGATEINLEHERLSIAIENAETVDDLKSLDIGNKAVPFPVLKAYNKRMVELMAEPEKDFTNGLQ